MTNPLTNPLINPLTNPLINPLTNPLINQNHISNRNIYLPTSNSNSNYINFTNPINPINPINQINNYININNDKKIQKTVSKYFYYKIIDEWLKTDLIELLAFVEFNSDGQPQLIKSMNNYKVEKIALESSKK